MGFFKRFQHRLETLFLLQDDRILLDLQDERTKKVLEDYFCEENRETGGQALLIFKRVPRETGGWAYLKK